MRTFKAVNKSRCADFEEEFPFIDSTQLSKSNDVARMKAGTSINSKAPL